MEQNNFAEKAAEKTDRQEYLNSSSIENFKTIGLVEVRYPEKLKKSVEEVVDSWKIFCALPNDIKAKFAYTGKVDAEFGSGFELKLQPGATKDLKEDFHVLLQDRTRLSLLAKDIGNEQAMKFINNADQLINLIEPLISEFAQGLETNFQLSGLKKEVLDSKSNWTLRFLHYFGGREVAEQVGHAHADKGGFTLHLYESDNGLQYLDLNDKQWKEMPISENGTVIIPSLQMQVRSKNEIRALCHRVVATEETAKTGRYAMVCFIDLPQTPKYNKEVYGRMQEFGPGFNYEIDRDKFSSMFVK